MYLVYWLIKSWFDLHFIQCPNIKEDEDEEKGKNNKNSETVEEREGRLHSNEQDCAPRETEKPKNKATDELKNQAFSPNKRLRTQAIHENITLREARTRTSKQ